MPNLHLHTTISQRLPTRSFGLPTLSRLEFILLLSISLSSQAATPIQVEIKETLTAIDVQQTAILADQSQLDALHTDTNKYSNKIVRTRMSIKQLTLDIKRQTMHLKENTNNSEAKNALRTARYKKRVAEIDLNKSNKQQNLTKKKIESLSAANQLNEEKLFELSEQLEILQVKASDTAAKNAAAKAKQRKKQALAKKRKQQLKKKQRKQSAKPKVLSVKEQALLEQRQKLIRQQAALASNSLTNTMLLNTQAIALVPITGTPNLGLAPMLKQRINPRDKYKSVGYLKHLGNSQYILETKLESGKNSFRVEEFEYRKQVAGQDSGKQALLLIDARNVRNPEFTLIKK